MKRTNTTLNLAAVAASALALTGLSANAATTVWNVNVGAATGPAGGNEITTTDNYVGAATENTANSTWNGVSGTGSTTLADSTGDNSAGVTLSFTQTNLGFGQQGGTIGDEVFKSWMKDNNNDYVVTFGNLSATATYSLVVYSGWLFGPEALVVTGLGVPFTINSPKLDGAVLPSGLAEDTNSANVPGNFNYARFDGLAADGSNDLAFTVSANDAAVNGFQLVQVPEPSAAALLGLSGLALLRRRRK